MRFRQWLETGGMIRLYRAEDKNVQSNAPSWMKEDELYQNVLNASGRWFTDSLKEAQWYINQEYPDGHIVYVDLPAEEAEQYRVSNLAMKKGYKDVRENPAAFSRRPDREFFLPIEIARMKKPMA